MKNILTLVDDTNAQKLIEKSLRLMPDCLFILIFTTHKEAVHEATLTDKIDSILKSLKVENCVVEKFIVPVDSNGKKIEKVIELSIKHKVDAVVIHRQKVIKSDYDLAFEKGLLKGLAKTCLLMCGDKQWKKNVDILGTLDINDNSTEQKHLNSIVLNTSIQLVGRLSASLHLMTVIAMSRINNEFDITDPEDVLIKKGRSIKAALENYAEKCNATVQFSAHVSAGLPAKEIPSFANKLKADLVVLGNVGRTGIKGLIVGNTAEKILRRLAVDILIAKN